MPSASGQGKAQPSVGRRFQRWLQGSSCRTKSRPFLPQCSCRLVESLYSSLNRLVTWPWPRSIRLRNRACAWALGPLGVSRAAQQAVAHKRCWDDAARAFYTAFCAFSDTYDVHAGTMGCYLARIDGATAARTPSQPSQHAERGTHSLTQTAIWASTPAGRPSLKTRHTPTP